MAQQLVGHRCLVCRAAFKTRKRAKEHVECSHPEKVSHKKGPGHQVDYIWLEVTYWKSAL